VNDVLLHLLILWLVLGPVLAAIFIVKRRSEHYSSVRQAAEHEATALGDVVALSGSLPAREGHLLRQQTFCYATDVIDPEWSRTDGVGSPSLEGRERAGRSSSCSPSSSISRTAGS
jgi:hypothetical protein